MEQKEYAKLKCSQHGFNVKYFQVKGIDKNKQGQSLFYCLDCVEEDKSFNSQNYIQFKEFIQSNINNQVNPEWPPWNDQLFLKKYIQLQLTQNEIQSYEDEIIKYYDDFKVQLIKQIDFNMKKCLEEIRNLKNNKQELIDKYIELTKINQLKNIFLVDSQTITDQIEQKYKELLKNITSNSDEIKQKLCNYAIELRNDKTFDSKNPNFIKDQVLQNISNITFLTKHIIQIDPQKYNNLFQTFKYVSLDKKNVWYLIDDQIVEQDVYRNEKNELRIKKQLNNNETLQICSDRILSDDNTYIFRIEIEQIQNGLYCCIGLLFENNLGGEIGTLKIYLEQDNNELKIEKNLKILYQQEKGEGLILSDERIIEMRVNINQNIIEFMDYPHYNYKIKINMMYYLIQKNYRLYFSTMRSDSIITLKEAFILS